KFLTVSVGRDAGRGAQGGVAAVDALSAIIVTTLRVVMLSGRYASGLE
ncbi:Unknown protein sequence, partial [Pseudomonas meliae]